MYFILEKESDFEKLELQGPEYRWFVDPITTNDYYHPKLSGLVAVYVRPLKEDETDPKTGEVVEKAKGFIIPVCHDEGLNVPKERVIKLLESFKEIWVLNKKSFLYQFNLSTPVHDLSLKYAMLKYEKLAVSSRETTYNWYYNRYGGVENINQIIPLPKIYQKCEDIFEQIKEVVETLEEPAGFKFYDNLATKAYFLVEQEGLRVDVHDFVERFKPMNPDFSIKGETVFTSYNLYNATSRPTNSFNSVNFLAIPKGREFRRCFKPSNDEFVQFDFDGYHVRLVAELVGYLLDSNIKAHKQLVKLRTGREDLSHEEYIKAKAENFKIIYGTPSEQDAQLEFSQKVQKKIAELWSHFEAWGNIFNKQSCKSFSKKELQDMYPSKLFNYLIQSLETSRNVLILCKVLGFLARGGFKSKVVLITYDSFLVDYAKSDGEPVLEGIRKIMSGEPEHKMNETPLFPVSFDRSCDLNFE